MRTHGSRPLESGGHRQPYRTRAAQPPSASDGIVLANALRQERFQDGACAILCPGCGEVITQYCDGLPEPFVRLSGDCPGCSVTPRPWSVVVVPNSKQAVPSSETIRQRVQTHWERQFRTGASDPNLPYTREFTATTQRLAKTWDWEWEVTCPLCDRSVAELEKDYLGYHHWWYDPDVGTSICDSCHDYVHGADSSGGGHRQQAIQQNWRAKKLGLRDLRDLGVIRLALRDRCVHTPGIPEDDRAYATRLQRRYNTPLSAERIITLLSEVRYHDEVLSVLTDYGPSPGVSLRDRNLL